MKGAPGCIEGSNPVQEANIIKSKQTEFKRPERALTVTTGERTVRDKPEAENGAIYRKNLVYSLFTER